MDKELCQHIKQSVDLAEYARNCGIELKRHGSKDLKGLCPFHDDKNPSLIISPAKGLFNCPACGTGGSVIDFAMKFHKIDFKEAVRELSGKSEIRMSKSETNLKIETEENLKPETLNSTLSPERQSELLEKAVSFYEKTFSNGASATANEGRKYLESRGLTDAGLFTKHRTGFADGSLLKALPSSGKVLDDLESLGILCGGKSGHFERFLNCVVVPVFDEEGNITTLYGRSVEGRKHVYLPDRPTGLFNAPVMKTYPEIVLVESVIDALSLEMAGINNVISIQSTNGLGDNDMRIMKECGIRTITLMLDGDKPGRAASLDLMGRLSENFSVSNIPLPDDHDPNSYLVKHGAEALQNLFSLAASPTADFADKGNVSGEKTRACGEHPRTTGNGFTVQMGLRHYEVIGLEKGQRSLKATIRVVKAGRIHVDTLDFYSARMRPANAP